jgi:signal transduction histidine kinase
MTEPRALRDLIVENRGRIAELIERRSRLRERSERATDFDAIQTFLAHLVDALAPTTSGHEFGAVLANTSSRISADAEHRGRTLQRRGCSVEQIINGYGDICQVVTQLADEAAAALSARDLSVMNRCLDDAVVSAVSAHARQRERSLAREELYRRQLLAYELNNLLDVARLSFESFGAWPAPYGSADQALHVKSLDAVRVAVNRSVSDARQGADLAPTLELVVVSELLSEVSAGATLQAGHRGLTLKVEQTGHDVAIAGDRHLLTSAIWSLLQNAFELTRTHSEVLLRATATATRVSIEVCDQCGGLPDKVDCLLRALQSSPRHANRRSGLGLAIAMGAAQAHLGDLSVRDVPGEGCVYGLDLPRHRPGALPPQLVSPNAQR